MCPRPNCRSRRWRRSSSASCRRARAGPTSRSGTASAACSRISASELALWSRNERPLLRYFPELRPLGELLPPRSALDGEIVIVRDGALDFDAMQMRLHPAESRIRRLSARDPGVVRRLRRARLGGRAGLEAAVRGAAGRARARRRGLPALAVDPRRSAEARGWLDRFESLGLDGVVAKRLGAPYLPGSRDGDGEGEGAQDRRLRRRRDPLEGRRASRSRRCSSASRARTASSTTSARARSRRGRAPRSPRRCCRSSRTTPSWTSAEPNRWGTGELEEARVRPELVVEVRYDKVQGNRFRHGTKLIRWREDKARADCTWRELRPAARWTRPTASSRFSLVVVESPRSIVRGEGSPSCSKRGRERRTALAATSRASGRRPLRAARGIVSIVKAAGSTVGDLVPAQRGRDARVGRRAHRVGAGDRPVAGVLAEVDEDADRSATRQVVVATRLVADRGARPPRRAPSRSGARRGTAARAGSARGCAARSRRRSSGTSARPSSSITSRTTSAISRTNGHWPSVVGSRSISR